MSALKFSANLGFLWKDLPLPEAIRAAHAAGFDAVECHWPYAVPEDELRAALSETALPMLGLNTRIGGDGDIGLSALPGRAVEARGAIDEAIDYADAIDAQAIHVMAGRAAGAAAAEQFADNLRYACAQTRRTILIEPLNRHDAPGYFLSSTDQARQVIETVAAPNLKLMFDCYHVARSEGDVTTRLRHLLPFVGHIQFAGVPGRGNPDESELHHPTVFAAIRAMGWTRPLGAEYRPAGATEDSLDWLAAERRAAIG
ncbi:Hydroxypyruvate isomerase [Candidatus Rhodobacter oscarellae]|uniref:Hydroxypyruvate isomerase n=1 Tax=Candidatus Rhodobacter oscarellae TaxID=1675527 RepID=A0A0J9E9F2_9RHOB|nr:TIM barrel protein [Candidatus Rhodobacter lobularis]KMW58299.1 Hydroxypyruvate isomerase [Candidatus Rhodobacter lobularis]